MAIEPMSTKWSVKNQFDQTKTEFDKKLSLQATKVECQTDKEYLTGRFQMLNQLSDTSKKQHWELKKEVEEI